MVNSFNLEEKLNVLFDTHRVYLEDAGNEAVYACNAFIKDLFEVLEDYTNYVARGVEETINVGGGYEGIVKTNVVDWDRVRKVVETKLGDLIDSMEQTEQEQEQDAELEDLVEGAGDGQQSQD